MTNIMIFMMLAFRGLLLVFLVSFSSALLASNSNSNSSSKFTMIGQENLRQMMWPQVENEDGVISNLGIINGDKVPEGKYHFAASLQLNSPKLGGWAHFCGGSILNDEYILTAAHCCFMPKEKGSKESIPLKPEMLRVTIGSHNLVDFENQIHLPVASLHPHSEFTLANPEKGSDVAVYKLAKKINFKVGDAIEKSCLPPSEKIEPKGEDCVVMGWGLTSRDTKNGRGSMKLLSFRIGMLDESGCRKKNFAGYDPKKLICASQENGGACSGDSGGVYLCPVKGDKDNWLQYGIVSFGGENCVKTTPTYYTRVSAYVDWIKKQVGEG